MSELRSHTCSLSSRARGVRLRYGPAITSKTSSRRAAMSQLRGPSLRTLLPTPTSIVAAPLVSSRYPRWPATTMMTARIRRRIPSSVRTGSVRRNRRSRGSHDVALLIGRILFAAISIVSGSTAHLLKWRDGVSYPPRQQRSRARAARARVGRDRTRRRAARRLRPLGRSRRAPAGRIRLPGGRRDARVLEVGGPDAARESAGAFHEERLPGRRRARALPAVRERTVNPL